MENPKAEKLALFRYGLIAPLVIEALPRGELTRRAEEIASRQYDIPDSRRRDLSVDTLLEWAKRYRQGGLETLAPKARQDRGGSARKLGRMCSLGPDQMGDRIKPGGARRKRSGPLWASSRN